MSVRVEVNVFELAVVFLRGHSKPSTARGMRGSAMSSKGARALVEGFNLSLRYDYNASADRSDYLFTTTPQSCTVRDKQPASSKYYDINVRDEDAYCPPFRRTGCSIDLDSSRLELSSIPIPLPTAIHCTPPASKRRSKDVPYNILFSHEDLLSAVNIFELFLGLKEGTYVMIKIEQNDF